MREFSGSHFRDAKTHSSFLNVGKFQSGYTVSQLGDTDRLKSLLVLTKQHATDMYPKSEI